MFGVLFVTPYARTTRYEEAFFPLETKEKKARFARVPYYYSSGKECWGNILRKGKRSSKQFHIRIPGHV